MAKRPHWTTEDVLEEILGDVEPGEEWVEPIAEDGRGEIDREEPLMEGSDEEFSDWEDYAYTYMCTYIHLCVCVCALIYHLQQRRLQDSPEGPSCWQCMVRHVYIRVCVWV